MSAATKVDVQAWSDGWVFVTAVGSGSSSSGWLRHNDLGPPLLEHESTISVQQDERQNLAGDSARGEADPTVAVPSENDHGVHPSRGESTGRELIDDLERLAALHERGALTDEEFAFTKRQLLGRPD